MGLWDVRGGKTQPVQIEQAEAVEEQQQLWSRSSSHWSNAWEPWVLTEPHMAPSAGTRLKKGIIC